MRETWVAEEMQILLGKPSKLEHGKNWEKFPTGGRGGVKKNSQPSFTWEVFRNRGGGGEEFSQSSQVHKEKGGQKGLKNTN